LSQTTAIPEVPWEECILVIRALTLKKVVQRTPAEAQQTREMIAEHS